MFTVMYYLSQAHFWPLHFLFIHNHNRKLPPPGRWETPMQKYMKGYALENDGQYGDVVNGIKTKLALCFLFSF